jgi:hypothetical protein
MFKNTALCIIMSIITAHHALPPDAISAEDRRKIGTAIFANECSKQDKYLVFWSPHESCISLGINHTIWFPQNYTGPRYTEGFPLLCIFLREQEVALPTWLDEALAQGGAPWKSREEFEQDQERKEQLRTLLKQTIDLQAAFAIHRLDEQWPKILAAAPDDNSAQKLMYHYVLLRSSLLGTYALVDYLNFKGDGLNQAEESHGHRWGLLQVLLAMGNEHGAHLTEDNAPKAFSVSAATILLVLIGNSADKDYSRFKWFPGWMKRVYTYGSAMPQ